VNYICKIPARPLGDFVQRFWQIQDAPPHRLERIVPSGTIEMVINLRENKFRIYDVVNPQLCKRFSGAIVSGTYQRPFAIDAQQHASVIGTHFRPGGAFRFLGMPADELADTHVDLEAIWGSMAGQFREELCAARHTKARFLLLEKALMRRLLEPVNHHYAVRLALSAFAQGGPKSSVRDVVEKLGVSHRWFIKLFAREVGLPPKLFCRVRRFQTILSSAQRHVAPNWSQLAWESGYSDQSHFINDFQGLCTA
jgi:AraC-like DNA-binding protein